jgi:hypothetical protein
MTEDMPWLLNQMDHARSALACFDFVAADRIRNALYASGVLFSWFAAELLGDEIARRRAECRALEKMRAFA